ncbi:Uncharacterised protein [Mycobacteroides abscessus]|nr:Uncharacterised protein [Mycobacteroides abscessus]
MSHDSVSMRKASSSPSPGTHSMTCVGCSPDITRSVQASA